MLSELVLAGLSLAGEVAPWFPQQRASDAQLGEDVQVDRQLQNAQAGSRSGSSYAPAHHVISKIKELGLPQVAWLSGPSGR